MTYTCKKHGKELKGPNKRGNYWHVIDFDKGEYCNTPATEVENGLSEGENPYDDYEEEDETPAERLARQAKAKAAEVSIKQGQAPAREEKDWSRVERQHSQEMAIRWMVAIGKATEDTYDLDALKETIDWFQKDLDNA